MGDKLLAVGDDPRPLPARPGDPGVSTRSSLWPHRAGVPFRSFRSLPRELEEVVRSFDEALVLRGSVSSEEFLDALTFDHSVFHFTGHGMSDVRRLGQALALAEGTMITMEGAAGTRAG